jgi:hypothetical protein
MFPRRWLKALQAADASRLAFLVLCDLATYADNVTGNAYPSLDTIAADLHVHVRKVKAAIAELKTIPGILTVQRRNRRAATPGERSNKYTLTMPADSRKKVASRFAPAKRDDRIGAVPSNDPITPDLPSGERQANLQRLEEIVQGTKLGTVPRPVGDSKCGKRAPNAAF